MTSKMGKQDFPGRGKRAKYSFDIRFLASRLVNIAHCPVFHRVFTGSIFLLPTAPDA
jgi:hypothetical protein